MSIIKDKVYIKKISDKIMGDKEIGFIIIFESRLNMTMRPKFNHFCIVVVKLCNHFNHCHI